MYEQVEKSKENKSKAISNTIGQTKNNVKKSFSFSSNRRKAVTQRKQREISNGHTVKQKIIQQKGVKAELIDAENKFDDFEEETSNINWLRDEVSNDIYNKYKPNPANANQHFKTKLGRDKSKGSMTESEALMRAKRLNHWSDTAIVSAERIYSELRAAHLSALQLGLGGEAILMGQDTDTEPDVFINNSTALEVKHVDSNSQGNVDNHVKKGSKQLDKRKYNENTMPKTAITNWQLHIEIKSHINPWPYTPTELDKLILTGKNPSSFDISKQAKNRIAKYEACSNWVDYWIRSANQNIGEIKVRV